MKLELNEESAYLLYGLADRLPSIFEQIMEDTEQLINIYRSVNGDLGVHTRNFEAMLLQIKKATLLASEPLSYLPNDLRKTADKIMDYINSDSLSDTSPKEKPKPNTSQQTEELTKKLLSGAGYIDGNKYAFEKKQREDGKFVLLPRHGSNEGYQKPDKYKFNCAKSTLYIVEDKNYRIENGLHSLVDNMVKQAANRIDHCLNVIVPEGVMENKNEGYIEKLVITFSVDLKGHEFHKDESDVLIGELQNLRTRNKGYITLSFVDTVKKHLSEKCLNYQKFRDKVTLRVVTLLGDIPNKPLDIDS